MEQLQNTLPVQEFLFRKYNHTVYGDLGFLYCSLLIRKMIMLPILTTPQLGGDRCA